MFDFKRILKIILAGLVLGGLLFLFFYAKNNQELVWETIQEKVDLPFIDKPVSKQELPFKENLKEIRYTWQSDGKDYELEKTFFESTNIFYEESPKAYKYRGEAPENWEDEYYGMFFQTAIDDFTISELTSKFKSIGEEKKLTDDQLVELVVAFVQKIEYDNAKANVILSNNEESINHPYETLFTQKGVCSDKSILAAAILRQLGYGTALFTYEAEKHMALGIKCPMQYSNDNSGYCYAETTSVGFRIGMIPDFDQNNRAVATQELKTIEEDRIEQFDYKRLSEAKIFQITEGKEYGGIAKTISIAREIDGLKITIGNLGKDISAAQEKIKKQEKELEEIIDDLDKQKKKENYEKYNSLVDDYNDEMKDYKKEIKKYNSLIKDYNSKVNRYNYLIKGF